MSDITPNTYFKLSLRDWVVVLIAVGGWTWGLINQNKVSATSSEYVSRTDFDLTKSYFDERINDANINYWKIERKLENMEKIQEARHSELLKAIFK